MVKNQVRSLVHVSHDRYDKLRFLFQYTNPRVQIGSRVIRYLGIKAHGMADHGSRKFRHQFLLGIFRGTEPATHLPVQTLRCHGGMSHFMEHGRIILHSATVSFFRRITDIELRLHGQHHYILRGRIIGTVLTLVGTYRT